MKEIMRGYTKFHKEPACFEWWSVINGERKVDDEKQTKALQQAFDMILTKLAKAKES